MRAACFVLGGALFGAGLALSGMASQEVVLSFLQLRDFGLLLVMGVAIGICAPAFALAPRALARPPMGGTFQPWRATLDLRTLGGAAVFGLGWGLSGICPGSALASLGTGNLPILIGLAGLLVGARLEALLRPLPSAAGGV